MKLTRKFLACFVISTAIFLNGTVAHAAADTVNGSNCFAANLAQASELQWNQARVLNPSDNLFSRFVVCNISTGQQFIRDGASLQLTTVESGSVSAFFSDDSDPGAEVNCVIRQISSSQTSNAGVDQVAVDIEAPTSLPGTASGSFSAIDGIDVLLGSSVTFTCRLDPGTGIQHIQVNHTLPS